MAEHKASEDYFEGLIEEEDEEDTPTTATAASVDKESDVEEEKLRKELENIYMNDMAEIILNSVATGTDVAIMKQRMKEAVGKAPSSAAEAAAALELELKKSNLSARAEQLLADDKPKEAIEQLRQLEQLQLDESSPLALLGTRFNICIAMYQMGKLEKALKMMEKVTHDANKRFTIMHHFTITAVFHMGILSAETRRYRQAVRFFDLAYDKIRRIQVRYSNDEYHILRRLQRALEHCNGQDSRARLAEVGLELAELLMHNPAMRELYQQESLNGRFGQEVSAAKQQRFHAGETRVDFSNYKGKHCANCGRPSEKLCTECEDITYCSRRCMNEHLPVHSTTCKGLHPTSPPPPPQETLALS